MTNRLIEQTLLPRLRLQTAQLELRGLTQIEALADWLESLPISSHIGHQPISEIGVSVSADFQRWTWRAAGEATAFIPRMADYFVKVGASQAELERLSQLGAELDPELLGYWLEMKSNSLNAGWYAPSALTLDEAERGLPSHAITALARLREWAEAYEIEKVVRLGRALGAGNPYAELMLMLPESADVEEQVYAATQLFADLKAALPPDDALALLMNLEQRGLGVSVWLSEQGVVKVGLLAAQPRTALVLELCRLVGMTELEPLAALEGILGVRAPAYVECQTRPNGFMVEAHYSLDLQETFRFD
jgi:hypothetical protein